MNGKVLHFSEVFSSAPSPGWPWSSTLLQLSALLFKFHFSLSCEKAAFINIWKSDGVIFGNGSKQQ